MSIESKTCGFVVVRVRLGARQEFEVIADRGVNTSDSSAAFGCQTTDGTSAAVFITVLKKIEAAIGASSPRIDLNVDDKKIVG